MSWLNTRRLREKKNWIAAAVAERNKKKLVRQEQQSHMHAAKRVKTTAH